MRKRLMNNIGLKILAFLIAGILWLVVVNIDNPVVDQTYSNIPVSVINEDVLSADSENPQTYQILDGTQTVNVTVVGKRGTLNEIKKEDIVATADMKELTLKTQIPITITINGYEGDYSNAYATPGNLQVKLEKDMGKKFPITPTTTGTVRDGYVLGDISVDPESVFLRGPESVIDRVSKVVAEVSVSGLGTDTSLKSSLVLYDSDNAVIDQSLLRNNIGTQGVTVNIQLLHTKRVQVHFDTSDITAAEGYSFAGITYEPKEIRVSGKEEELDQVTGIEVPPDALLVSGLEAGRTEKAVDLTPYIPDTVKLADENAGTVIVTIIVEKNGTKSLEMALGAIAVNNLANNLKLTYNLEDNLEIQVRGPKETLDTLAPVTNVTASIDLKSYKEAGSYEVPVDIQLPNECTLEQDVTVKLTLEKK